MSILVIRDNINARDTVREVKGQGIFAEIPLNVIIVVMQFGTKYCEHT